MIISEVENAEPGAPVITTLIGLVVLIILAVEPLTLPVIFSPLVNVPVCVVKLIVGATASVEAAVASYTATKANASARPKDISLSPGRVPYASVVPVSTLSCFINLVVLVFGLTAVFNKVAITLTFAPPEPNAPRLVIVNCDVPPPANPVAALTISPCLAEPPPPVKIEIV